MRKLSEAGKKTVLCEKSVKELELENEKLWGPILEESETSINMVSVKTHLKTYSSGYRKAA